jgi:prepilin-type N-terminal cleavage/methylation domain-containing protein
MEAGMSLNGLTASRRVLAPSRRFGFTIIELLTVIVILALLIGMSIGRISATITQQRLNRAAVATASDLQAAFALAQRDRKPVVITFNPSTMELKVTDAVSGTVLRQTSLANFNLNSSNIEASRYWLSVYPAGLANDSVSITLSATLGSTTYSQRIRMTRGGLVQIK